MNTINYIDQQPPDHVLNNPFGEDSIFHVVDDLSSEQNALEQYTHKIIWSDGLDVFKNYKSAAEEYTPKPKELLIFHEVNSENTTNLFGSACRIKMGIERRLLMEKLIKKVKTIRVKEQKCNSLKMWSQAMAKWYPKLEADKLESAITLEFQKDSNYSKVIDTIFGINNTLADWISSGVEALDDVKFTNKNYDYALYGEKIEPIIPIRLYKTSYEFLTQGGEQPYDAVKEKGLEQLTKVVIDFDDFVFGIARNVVAATPTLADDLILNTIISVKRYLQENLGATLEKLFSKLKKFVQQVKSGIEGFIDAVEDNLLMLNAFLCGLINGILSIVQAVMGIVAIVVDNISILEIDKANPSNLAEHQEKLEFIEDAIDQISENVEALFAGVVSQMLNLQKDILKLAIELWQTIKQYSKYFWAFFIGGVAFEFIVDAIIAFYTGGSSAFAKAASKISRLSSQLTQKSKTAIKGFGTTVAKNTEDLLQYLKKELAELIEAIKNGKLIAHLKRKFFEVIDNKEALRKLDYQDFIKLIPKQNLDYLIEHIFEGHLGIYRRRFLSAKGVHSVFSVKKNNFRIVKGSKRPPNSQLDELFEAKVEKKYTLGSWVKKRDNNGYSTFFPENWSKQRTLEEIAFAFKNKRVPDITKPHKLEGFSTNGIKIEFIIRNEEVKTVYPTLN